MTVPLLTPLDTPIFDEDVIAEIEEHLDDVVPCVGPTCEAPAWWQVIMVCCGAAFPMCDEHRARHRTRATFILAIHAGTFCKVCKVSLSGFSYDDAFRVVPL